MRPRIELDARVFAANAAAWRAFVAPALLYAVVKGEAYGWTLERTVPLLEPYADAFCVSDLDELHDLRAYSQKRAVVMGALSNGDLREALASNAVATMETDDDVRVGIEAGHVRLGLQPAAAWSGSPLERLQHFARLLAGTGAEVELWTHITDSAAADDQLDAFSAAREALQSAGVEHLRCDVASTLPFAAGRRAGDAVRIGVGLFGSAGGAVVPGLKCAISVRAPVVKKALLSAGARLGYGGMMLPVAQEVTTVRCGYSDGVPKALEGADDILSVGMQYMTLTGRRAAHNPVTIFDAETDLDAVAAHCACLPHQIVTALGNAAR